VLELFGRPALLMVRKNYWTFINVQKIKAGHQNSGKPHFAASCCENQKNPEFFGSIIFCKKCGVKTQTK
jgi:hypothetical protein